MRFIGVRDLAGLAFARGRFMDKTLGLVDQGFELCRGARPFSQISTALAKFSGERRLPASVLLETR